MQKDVDIKKIQELDKISQSVHRLAQNYLSSSSKFSSLTLAQMFLIKVIKDNGTVTPSSLAQRIGVTSGAITSLTDRLYKQGLVNRKRSDIDRRLVIISLTEKGMELACSLEEERLNRMKEIFSELTNEDIETLINIYGKINNTLTRLVN
ncbi:MarR family winged helix-turn-helix transcriptional regulator [Desulfofalx alkaliphila]|uniref:MarR family winged helix-turn-helix transcriptional regulator n=1 Tax=Desulfofalx alkaliphila TaxID=105483 RepID=UPI0006913BD0|nr:MarR family transcriptional regulator [Desulfofalx alkaliphila]